MGDETQDQKKWEDKTRTKKMGRQDARQNKAVYTTASVTYVGQGQKRKLDHLLAEKSKA